MIDKVDKVLLALPVELDRAERVDLVREFAAEVGRGRVAWLAGIHDQGRDADNPHAHILFRDRDFETGKRVVGFTEKGSTDRLRGIWERVANQALERAGHDARIDRRSLEAQGLAREAGIHIGPKALAMEERGVRTQSKPEIDRAGRVIDWPEINQGRSRIDRLAEIEAANDGPERERGKGGKGRTTPPTPEAGAAPRPAPAPERSAAEEHQAREAQERQRRAAAQEAAQEAARARSWVAPREGLDGLDERQRARLTLIRQCDHGLDHDLIYTNKTFVSAIGNATRTFEEPVPDSIA